MTTTAITRPEVTQADFGQAISRRLAAANITTARAAVALGVSQATMRRKLSGHSRIFTSDLFEVAQLTGGSAADLYDEAVAIAGGRNGR